MKPPSCIVLMTDYGLKDPYVGVMKGVIKKINPKVEVIDLTHEIPKFKIDVAAYLLLKTYKYFPKGSIFTCVIDPTVGSPRRPILIVTRNYYFIGPDNGLLTLAANDDGVEYVVHLTNEVFYVKPVSMTFHGRDIFAPAAAYVSLGVNPLVLGKTIRFESIETLKLSFKVEISEGEVITNVFLIDDFGNVILPIDFVDFIKRLNLSVGISKVFIKPKCAERKLIAPVVPSFSSVCEGCLAVYEDSYGLTEIGVFMGNASQLLGLKVGDKVCIGKV